VIISPIENGVAVPAEQVAGRAERLLATLDKARNVGSIGDFNRGELFDRDLLR